MMTTEQRIRMCILIEKMNKQQLFSKKLGIEDKSTFHGEYIEIEEEEISCYQLFLQS